MASTDLPSTPTVGQIHQYKDLTLLYTPGGWTVVDAPDLATVREPARETAYTEISSVINRGDLAFADIAAANLAYPVTNRPTGLTVHLADLTQWTWNGVTWVTITGSGTGDMLAANNLADVANVVTARSNLGLAIGTNVQAYDAELAAVAGLTSAANKVPYFTGSGTAALADFSAAGRALVDDADAAAQRTTLGLGTAAVADIGTGAGNVVGASLVDAKGDLLVGTADNTIIRVAVGSNTQVLTADSTQASGVKWAAAATGTGDMLAANNLSDVANITTARSNLGLAIGTNVQAYDAELAALAGLTSAADKLPYFTGSGTAALADITAAGRALLDDAAASNQRTTLGLGTAAVANIAYGTSAPGSPATGDYWLDTN